MTTTELEQSIRDSGLHAACGELQPNGEVPIDVMNADGRNPVHLRFPYKALDDRGLTDALLQLYFNEMNLRRAKRLEKKKK